MLWCEWSPHNHMYSSFFRCAPFFFTFNWKGIESPWNCPLASLQVGAFEGPGIIREADGR